MSKKEELESLRNLEYGALAGNMACLNNKEITEQTMLKYEKKIIKDSEVIKEAFARLEKLEKVIEIVKNHILNRDNDTSGIYLEFHNGFYESYYTIEIRKGVKQIFSLKESNLLTEVFRNENK